MWVYEDLSIWTAGPNETYLLYFTYSCVEFNCALLKMYTGS